MHIIKVLIPKFGLHPLFYSSHTKRTVGELVIVPFRNKEITGIIWQIDCDCELNKLKEVKSDQAFMSELSESMLRLINKASEYYLSELGTIAKLVLPVDVNESPIIVNEQIIDNYPSLPKLSTKQNECLELIEQTNIPILIKGVTGSGKTEVYFYAIMNQLLIGKQALIMLPEIALSEQIIARFTERFGFKPAIWNSKISKAQKKRILRGVIKGTVKIVIGARSTLFLPYKNLGIIVVDEEHDASYKQNDGILYNARDMAVLRGAITNCKILLISATPSIESIYNVQLGKYKLFELKDRFNDALMPNIQIVDMRKESILVNNWLSQQVKNAIKANFEKKEQTLIFLNRRGYAPLMLCKSCGHKVNCHLCSASMVMHKELNRLECHHCGNILPIYKKCPECDVSDGLVLCGPGVERIEEEVKRLFPEYKIAVASKDQSFLVGEMQTLLKKMENQELDVLIGTQIITKGYHFPNLTLVIVIDADIGFVGGDLRASERTFQLLHQVGGRAGRADKKGLVILQTYLPEHNVIKAIIDNKEDEFIQNELLSRKASEMPPFSKVASITIAGKDADKTKEFAKAFASYAPRSSARILGPTEAMMYKLSGKYRYKILVIAAKNFNLQKYLKLWQETFKLPSAYQIKFDIDPQQLW
ncbi:MAG: primosomal protein N' [Rickettsiales bacterium]|nr:MAG: primosomal protein N' [Rickettsiales bacterium]